MLPKKIQEEIIEKKLKFYVINAYTVAKEAGMGNVSIPFCKPVSLRSAM